MKLIVSVVIGGVVGWLAAGSAIAQSLMSIVGAAILIAVLRALHIFT